MKIIGFDQKGDEKVSEFLVVCCRESARTQSFMQFGSFNRLKDLTSCDRSLQVLSARRGEGGKLKGREEGTLIGVIEGFGVLVQVFGASIELLNDFNRVAGRRIQAQFQPNGFGGMFRSAECQG